MPQVYNFSEPPFPSAGVYYFTSDSGTEYEVRFGRKQADILFVNIVFGAINDEYEGEEYVLTNKGDFYSVMLTIEAIIKHFKAANPNVHSYEFAGEPIESIEDNDHITKRTHVYLRYAKRIFHEDEWEIKVQGNKVSIERLKHPL